MSGTDKEIEETFQLTLNRKQLELISRGLECLSRLRAGQLTYLRDELFDIPGTADSVTVYNALKALKKVIFPQYALNESNHGNKDCWECLPI